MVFSFVLILLLFITTGLAINFRHQLNSAKRRGNYGKPVRSSSPLLACPFCGMDAVLLKNLIEKADALADFPGVFIPSDDDKTDDETNEVWNDFIDALNLAKVHSPT